VPCGVAAAQLRGVDIKGSPFFVDVDETDVGDRGPSEYVADSDRAAVAASFSDAIAKAKADWRPPVPEPPKEGESMEDRVQREKRNKYHESDEYREVRSAARRAHTHTLAHSHTHARTVPRGTVEYRASGRAGGWSARLSVRSAAAAET